MFLLKKPQPAPSIQLSGVKMRPVKPQFFCGTFDDVQSPPFTSAGNKAGKFFGRSMGVGGFEGWKRLLAGS